MSKNVRNMTITTADGKDVRDTRQLSGEAVKSKVANEKNSQAQYTTGAPPKGSLGGMNTNS